MNYWERRQSDTLERILKKADASADEIANIYAKSSFYLNSKIEGIFDRYRSKYGLSIQEAKILLNQLDDITSYEEMIKILRNSNDKDKQELLKYLDSPAYHYRIERLQNVQRSIDDVMQNIYNQEKKISTLNYIDVAHDSYFRTVFNMQKNLGYEFNFSNINPKYIDTLLHANWSGKNYSERIWNNTKELSKQLKEELLIGVLTGKSERDMQKEISERFQVGNYKARRLIQTESAYMSTMMDLQAYEEADVDTVRFVAMHDLKTSKICQRHDGKYIEIKNAVVGSNTPPLHPNCRSFVVPVIDEDLDKGLKRRIKDENGQYRIVDANETYEEWYERTQKKEYDNKGVMMDSKISMSKQNDRTLDHTPKEFRYDLKKEYSLLNVFADIDKRFMEDGFEHMAIVNSKDGTLLKPIMTSKSRKFVKPDEKSLGFILNSELKSLTLIHNHPSSSPFSIADIITTNNYQAIKESIVINTQGEVYFLSIPQGKEIDLSTKELIEQFQNVIMKQREKYSIRFPNMTKKDIAHLAYAKIFERLGWNYGRKKY